MFLDDADDELKQNATQICGAENLECIYDMVMTGSEEIAEDTKVTGLKHTETVNSIGTNATKGQSSFNSLHLLVTLSLNVIRSLQLGLFRLCLVSTLLSSFIGLI